MQWAKTKMHPLVIMFMALFFAMFIFEKPFAYGFTEQVLQRGATGDDVVELQARLQYIGFYNGKIHGVFDWQTYWAVRNYQEQFGLKVDGLVGNKTKASLLRTTNYRSDLVDKALREARKFTHYGGVEPFEKQFGEKGSAETTNKPAKRWRLTQQQKQQTQQAKNEKQPKTPQTPQWSNQQKAPGQNQQPKAKQQPKQQAKSPAQHEPVPHPEPLRKRDGQNQDIIEKAINVPAGFSENDIQMMAQTVYGEARGEPYIGQVAIAAVIINRLNSPIFPNTVAGIIFEPQAFTAVSDGQIYNQPDETARKAVLDAINGHDPTGGAVYYFNPETATNPWIWSRPQIKRIGKHIFCH